MRAFGLGFVALLAVPVFAPAAERTELVFTYIDGAETKSYSWGRAKNETAEGWTRTNANKPVDGVLLYFYRDGKPVGRHATFNFSTEYITGKRLEPGTYYGVRRRAEAPKGAPGAEITFNALGFQDYSGVVTVLTVEFDSSRPEIELKRFAATFDLRVDGRQIYGHVYYRFDPDAVPPPAPVPAPPAPQSPAPAIEVVPLHCPEPPSYRLRPFRRR